MHQGGEEDVRDLLDAGVQDGDRLVVELAPVGDLVLERRDPLLQLQEVLVRLEVGVVLGDREQALEGGRHLGAGLSLGGGTLRPQVARAGGDHLFKSVPFVLHVPLAHLHQPRDLVVALLLQDLDVRPRLVDVDANGDQLVVDADEIADDHEGQDNQHDQEDHGHAHLRGASHGSARPGTRPNIGGAGPEGKPAAPSVAAHPQSLKHLPVAPRPSSGHSRAMRSRSLLVPFLASMAALAACAWGGGGDSADRHGEGVRRMAARLEAIARDTHPVDHPWRNAERAEELRATLTPNLEAREYLEVMPNFAGELLKAGKTEESIEALKKLEQFSTSGGTSDLTVENRRFLRHRLAVAYLRLGEQQNCQEHHNTESCLMPIQGGGLHARPQGSQEAVAVLTQQMKETPDDLSARWWLNIAAMTLGDYPDHLPKAWLIPPKVFESEYDIGRFHDRAGDLGLDVDDLAGGSISEDFDGDGYLDIMASSTAVHGQLRYFHNDGNGSFSDRTADAGLVGEVESLNIVQTDYDNDGHPDVLMLRGGWLGKAGHLPKSLLHNNGDGTFDDVTEAAGLLSFHPSQTAAWVDYDNDGWLDLIVGNESTEGDPNPSELYHNNRNGTFTECAAASGLTIDCFVKGVTAGDYNNDGRPDLYVSCRKEPNKLYRNDGPKPSGAGPTEWRFAEVGAAAGVVEPIHSFPTWFFDYDNDGWLDLFVAGYNIDSVKDFAADSMGLPHQAERARLYHNQPDGTFKDVTREAHLFRLLHAMGSNYGDLDNDGWLDFYVGTGDPNLGTLVPNRMFRNASGRVFQEVTTSGGFGHLQKGHGVSFADFDEDGDQDIHEVMGGVYEADHFRNVLYENPGHGNHSLKLKLEGVKSNRAAIGARVRVVVDAPSGPREIHRSVTTGGSFGANPLRLEIGLGDARAIEEIRITWPTSGIVQTLKGAELDRAYAIREDSQDLKEISLKPFVFRSKSVVASGGS